MIQCGPGTHLVCYSNNYYFDPFGMPPHLEVRKYIKDIKYNDIQYQDIRSVLCGYYCLYFLKRLNDGYKIYDILYIFCILYKDFDFIHD